MCGICGFLKSGGRVDRQVFDRMVDSMSHRGPDDRGTLFRGNKAIGMRRLSIIDLASGRQPMSNEDGSIHVVYNGEIYNHMELREELSKKGHRFRTDHSDTEVLIHGYEEWGIEGLARRLNGIYAFAVLDEPEDRILLVRDRFGVKPLYYSLKGDSFVFASEVKTLLLSGSIDTTFSDEALAFYLRYQFVPGSQTILKDVKKLLPAEILEYRDGNVRTTTYWDFPSPAIRRDETMEDCAHRLRELLFDTVKRQMMSDVPIGVFLSGGLDSTIIAYLMARNSEVPIRSYSIVFPGEEGFDESAFSSKVAEAVGSDHRVIAFDEKRLIDVVDGVIESMDEPVADPAMVPTYYMAGVAAKDVKVVLTGEGADEVFAGYPYYRQFVDKSGYMAERYVSLKAVRAGLKTIKNRMFTLKEFGCLVDDLELPPSSSLSGFPYAMSDNLIMLFMKDLSPTLIERLQNYEAEVASRVNDGTPLQRALYVDTKLWLAEDLMLKLDRMTMAHSLEARVPFLDHRVVEFVFNMPDEFKVASSGGKFLLREAMKDIIDKDIANRTKQGFNLPFNRWFRGRLREFVQDSLTKESVETTGLLDYEAVKRLLRCHMEYGMNTARPVWMLVVLCLWNRHIRRLAASREV